MTDAHDHSPRRPRSRRMELLAAIASGFVGALALATSTYNVYLQRQQVRAQVWPHLVLKTDFGKEAGFKMALANRGVGPAVVKSVAVRLDDKPIEDWVEAESLLLHKTRFSSEISPIEDEVMSPGLEITWFRIKEFDDAREFLSGAQAHKLDIDVCYCSTLGDCWTLDSSEAIRGQCPTDPHPFHSISSSSVKALMVKLAKDASSADGGTRDGGSDGASPAP